MEDRISRLSALMAERKVDAVALVPGANLFYLTGLQMQPSERITLGFLNAAGEMSLILPALEVPRAQALLARPVKLYPWADDEGSGAAWSKLKRDLDLAGTTVAVEYLAMRVLELSELEAFAPAFKIQDASRLLAELRMVKDASEIDAMRRAARVIESSLDQVVKLVKPGVTEKELAVAWQLDMSRCGADGIPEEPIVASGPNTAAPHFTASGRPLARGDMVIFDGWCQVDGYFTDITRTVSVGEVSPEMRKVYETVAEANAAGRERAAPGVAAQQVDRAARDAIERAGYGSYFIHRTGHGLGLEVHEAPAIVEGNDLQLLPGMTFTVEPGIYIAGQGGVRIEDDVLVTQDSAESLTTYTRELLVL